MGRVDCTTLQGNYRAARVVCKRQTILSASRLALQTSWFLEPSGGQASRSTGGLSLESDIILLFGNDTIALPYLAMLTGSALYSRLGPLELFFMHLEPRADNDSPGQRRLTGSWAGVNQGRATVSLPYIPGVIKQKKKKNVAETQYLSEARRYLFRTLGVFSPA